MLNKGTFICKKDVITHQCGFIFKIELNQWRYLGVE
jgi:hypothetical protein